MIKYGIKHRLDELYFDIKLGGKFYFSKHPNWDVKEYHDTEFESAQAINAIGGSEFLIPFEREFAKN